MIGKGLFSSVAIVPRNVDGVDLGYGRELQLFGISERRGEQKRYLAQKGR